MHGAAEKYSFTDAAEHLLKQAKHLMHCRELTQKALDGGIIETSGKTPEATMYSVIHGEIKRAKARGDQPRFVMHGKGLVGLSEWDAAETHQDQSPSGAGSRPRQRTYSFTDAAEEVLKQAKDKDPMHYREITQRALECGLIETSGKTPEATMYSVIHQEIERAKARGDQPRFVRHGKGYFGLSAWMAKGLAFEIEQHNRTVRKKLKQKLHELTPEQFEAVVGELLVALGFEDVKVTTVTADGGIDVRGMMVIGDVIRTRMAVQAKRWKKNVPPAIVQQVRGSLGPDERGLIITTSDFSSKAMTEAERVGVLPIALMNGEQMAALLVEHDVGVEKTGFQVLELGELGAAHEASDPSQ